MSSADQSRDVSNILTAVMTSPSLHESAANRYNNDKYITILALCYLFTKYFCFIVCTASTKC